MKQNAVNELAMALIWVWEYGYPNFVINASGRFNVIREINAGCDDHQLYMVFTDGTEISNISYVEFFGTDSSPIHRHTISAFSIILFLMVVIIALMKYNEKLKIVAIALVLVIVLPRMLVIQVIQIPADSWQFEYDNLRLENFVFRLGKKDLSGNNAKVLYYGSEQKNSGWATNIGRFVALPMVQTENKLMREVQLLNDNGKYPDESDIENILTIYAEKPFRSTSSGIKAKLYDVNGEYAGEIEGQSSRESLNLTFTNGTLYPNIARIEFFGVDGSPISLKPDFYIGVVRDNNASE